MLSHSECLSLCDPMDCSLQVPLSTELSIKEYWSGLLFPLPGDLLDTGIEPVSPALVDGFFTTEMPGKSIFTQRPTYKEEVTNSTCNQALNFKCLFGVAMIIVK